MARDTVPVADVEAAGHSKRPLLAVIRAKCLDCCGGNSAEVRRCAITACALWPYRFRSNPFNTHPGRFRRSISPTGGADE